MARPPELADTVAPPRRLWWVRAGAALAILLVLLLVGRELGGYVVGFAGTVEALGPLGPLVFIAGYAVATVAFVPGALLTMAAGAIFGLLGGAAYVFAGALIGSSAAFLIARYLARARLERRLANEPRFRAIDRAIGAAGVRIVLLLRLSPIFPYNLLNYALGLTSVRFAHYAAAGVGMIPGIFLYVYAGLLIGDLAAIAAGAPIERGAAYTAVLGAGFAATVMVVWYVTRLARRALREVEP